jgi:hypothetical protein
MMTFGDPFFSCTPVACRGTVKAPQFINKIKEKRLVGGSPVLFGLLNPDLHDCAAAIPQIVLYTMLYRYGIYSCYTDI